jgi:HCOMODA/2-hydroxy-3-carboxy-muconic semialdehyde decarboxylase
VTPSRDAQVLVRRAARALGRSGLVHAYGHCSSRLDAGHFLVCAARPMGLIAPGEDGEVVPVNGPLPEGVLGEVRIHQHIYRNRPDVGGIVRSMPPKTMSLSTLRLTPKARHGTGSYFAPCAPLWDDPQLIRSEQQAMGVAATLAGSRAVVMRGNGVVTAGASLEEAVVFTWYLEDAARVELDVLAALGSFGGHGGTGASSEALFSAEEAKTRAVGSGRIYERMWEYLTHGDPE